MSSDAYYIMGMFTGLMITVYFVVIIMFSGYKSGE